MEAPADHWIRAEEITRKVKGEPTNEGRMLLFEGSIDPGDVVQVGSCFPPPTPGFVRPRQWGSAGRCEHCRHMLQHVAPQLRTLWPHGHPAHPLAALSHNSSARRASCCDVYCAIYPTELVLVATHSTRAELMSATNYPRVVSERTRAPSHRAKWATAG